MSLRAGDVLECVTQGGEVHLARASPSAPPTPDRQPVHISCFRKFSLRMNGKFLAIPHRKAAELIAYLSCAWGEPTSKAEIASVLWPDVDEKRARDSLYKTCNVVKKLRHGNLSFPLVDTRGEAWIDMTRASCDLIEFEQLYRRRGEPESCRRAIDLYRGPLLDEDLYDWTTEATAYYEIRCLEMLETLARQDETSDNERLTAYYRRKLELLN